MGSQNKDRARGWEPRPLRTVVCPHCGKTFETRDRYRKFCSYDCFRLNKDISKITWEGPCPQEWTDRVNRMIGDNLRRMREKQGCSMRYVQAKTGIIWRTIAEWEEGNHSVPLVKAIWLCKKMNWRLSDLLKGGINNDAVQRGSKESQGTYTQADHP